MSSEDEGRVEASTASWVSLVTVGGVLAALAAALLWPPGWYVRIFVSPIDVAVGLLAVAAGVQAGASSNERPHMLRVVEGAADRLAAWFDRPIGPAVRTIAVILGTGATALSLAGIVDLATREFGATGGGAAGSGAPSGAGIGLAVVFLGTFVFLGVILVGFGASFQGRGGWLTIPAIRFTPVQRLLVTGGTFLTALGLLATFVAPGLGAKTGLPIPDPWSVCYLGLKLLLLGLAWALVRGTWRWLRGVRSARADH